MKKNDKGMDKIYLRKISIGNYMNHSCTNENFKVQSIDLNENKVNHLPITLIRAIKLDSDWFKRFNFEIKIRPGTGHHFYLNGFYFMPSGGSSFQIIAEGSSVVILKIQFVHELQNFFMLENIDLNERESFVQKVDFLKVLIEEEFKKLNQVIQKAETAVNAINDFKKAVDQYTKDETITIQEWNRKRSK